MRRGLFLSILLLAGFLAGPLTSQASACPMCQSAVKEDDRQPKAYMYSILFMLAVPATIFSGLGFGLYRMNRAEQSALADLSDPTPNP